MNTAVLKITALCATLLLSAAMPTQAKSIKGSGNIITRTIKVNDDYKGIDASRAINVTVEERSGDNVVIKGDDNIMPYVEVVVEDDILNIRLKNDINSVSNCHIEVSLPNNNKICKFYTSSAASIDVKPEIKKESLDIDASSASHIIIAKAEVKACNIEASSSASVSGAVKASELCNIETSSAAKVNMSLLATRCLVDSSSASNVTLTGEAGLVEFETGSAASIDGENLNARKGLADASSGSKIKVNCMQELEISVSSGASVKYKGGCSDSVSIDKSSGGSATRL